MRFVALVLSLVGLLVGLYAVGVAAPEHARVEREWLSADAPGPGPDEAALRMRGLQARLQLVATVAIGSSIMGIILGFITRLHDGGSQPTIALVAGFAGLAAGLYAGFGDRMF
jgi:hypothetical protein